MEMINTVQTLYKHCTNIVQTLYMYVSRIRQNVRNCEYPEYAGEAGSQVCDQIVIPLLKASGERDFRVWVINSKDYHNQKVYLMS